MASSTISVRTETLRFARYHELMRKPNLTRAVAPKSVVGIIDQFLEWCEKHRAPKTYEWYRQRLQLFIDDGIPAELLVRELKPFHLQQWIDSYPGLTLDKGCVAPFLA